MEIKDPTDVDYTKDQYQSITLGMSLLALLLIIILSILAYTKIRNFQVEREEERELEIDEMEYRNAIERKRS
jgi:hypothetical protein